MCFRQEVENSFFYPIAHFLILWPHNSHIGILYVGEKWLLLERLLQISKSNRIIREAVEEKREESERRQGKVHNRRYLAKKNLYTEDT